MGQEKNSVDKFLEVVSEIKVAKGDTIRTSHELTNESYQKFKLLCDVKGVHPSELLDRMVQEIVERYADDLPKPKKEPVKKTG